MWKLTVKQRNWYKSWTICLDFYSQTIYVFWLRPTCYLWSCDVGVLSSWDLYLKYRTVRSSDLPLQVLVAQVVQVGQGVRGFQGCQAHHLFLEVQDFPEEENEFSLEFKKDVKEQLKKNNTVCGNFFKRALCSLNFRCILQTFSTCAWQSVHSLVFWSRVM